MKHKVTPEEAEAILTEVEDQLAAETGRALRRFLRELTDAATRPDALTASVEPGPLPPTGPVTLGQVAGWWASVVNADLLPAIRKAWEHAYKKFRGGQVIATSQDALPEFVQNVSDRLVRGLTPPVYEDSFDRIRASIVQSAAQGWSRPELAQRIAAELSWEDRGPYWRDQLSATDRKIDAILDPLGEPGTPARDWAQYNDPAVQALRDDRNRAIKALDAEQSHWKTRSDRIARTESTSANNNAALQALQDEDWASKEWIATLDSRTRPSHAALHGQRVEIGAPFVVDGYEMQHPGDPSAPPGAVVNCRCALVGSDEPPTELPPEPEPEELPEPGSMLSDELDAELAELMGAGDFDNPRMQLLAEEMDRREDPGRRTAADDARDEYEWQQANGGKLWRRARGSGSQRQIDRDEFDLWVESAFVEMERATKGNIINRRGQAMGITPKDYLTRRRTSNEWLTQEAQEWIAANPTMSFNEWRGGRRTHLERNEWT